MLKVWIVGKYFLCTSRSHSFDSKLLCTVCVQVSVGYVSRGPEGGCPTAASTPPPPLSLSLLVSRHEPHLRRHVCTRTATVLYDSVPTCCASPTAAHTGMRKNQNLLHIPATLFSGSRTFSPFYCVVCADISTTHWASCRGRGSTRRRRCAHHHLPPTNPTATQFC